MLPGIRFLFAAVALAVSMLVFGLGAAALLRASHEQFANVMTVRPAPVQLAARPAEPATPTLSMLRVEPTPELQTPDAPAAASPAPAPEPAAPSRAASPSDPKPEGRNEAPKATLDQTTDVTLQAAAPEPVAPASSPAPAQADKPSQQSNGTPPAGDSAPRPAGEATKPDQTTFDNSAQPRPGTTAAPSAASAADALSTQSSATPEPGKPDVITAEPAKPAAPVAQTEKADQPAAVPTSAAAAPKAARSEDGEALPQVAALTGRIPTPRRDPRAPAKPFVGTSDQQGSADKGQDQAVQPDAPETTSSITKPEQTSDKPSASRPKATRQRQVKRKVKRRRQTEVRKPTPVFARPALAPMQPFGFPPT